MTEGITHHGRAAATEWRDTLARVGLVAKGVLYLVLGLLAIQFARGEASSDEVSQTGAIQTVAEQPFGKFLLVALVVGLAALTLWHVIQAVYGDPIEGDETFDRLKFAGKAVIYGALTVTAGYITVDNWNGGHTEQASSGDSSNQEAASALLDLPAGQWLVGALGLALIAAAGYQVYTYVIQSEHMERIAGDNEGLKTMGRIGYAARAIVIALSGVFFIVAAVQHDPEESKGLSGALQELAERDGGRLVLWLVAIGLALFGLFCLAEAKLRPRT